MPARSTSAIEPTCWEKLFIFVFDKLALGKLPHYSINPFVMPTEAAAAVLKNELHRLVVLTDDEEVLRQVKSVFEFLLHEDSETDWWVTLSDKEQMQVQQALQELDKGERMTHEAVRAEINQMLGK